MNHQFFPLISEKSLDLTSKNRYTFKVDRKMNKPELKKSIEKVYRVNVERINIINQLGKRKRTRLGAKSSQRWGKRSDFKKAIVRLKKGQKIKEFEIETKEDVKNQSQNAK